LELAVFAVISEERVQL